MELIDKIAKGARKVRFHGKCSWFKCKKKIDGIAYTDPLFATVGFVFCSRDCIREHLEYLMTDEAIINAAEHSG